MLSRNPPKLSFDLVNHDTHKEIADCFLRPETLLKEREEEWKLVFPVVLENNNLQSYALMTETDCTEYATVRLFKKLKSCLERLDEVFPVEETRRQLSKPRYDLETLRELPHV